MYRKITIILVTLFTIFLFIGCIKKTDTKTSDHSHKNHSSTEKTYAEKPIQNTINQIEIRQQQFKYNIEKWHSKNILGNGIKIAILDTGIDLDNKDLNYIRGENFLGNNKRDFNDNNGHGTKIAGIIGARMNNYNLLGISPNSDLYIAKVADRNGNVKVNNLIKGIYWAIDEKVHIINISIELSKSNRILHKAIKEANKNGIIVIASSGNIRYKNDTQISYPGSYPEVINVGMLNDEGKIFSSEFKKKKVDVYAPGEDIFSLYLNDKMTLDTGVSFSTAYTTGYTALLIQYYQESNKNYDINKIKKDLKKYLMQ